MTREEADREADRLWGDFARSLGCVARTSPSAFAVGISRGRDMWVLGRGESWEEAFQEAGRSKPPTEAKFTRWRARVMGFRGSV